MFFWINKNKISQFKGVSLASRFSMFLMTLFKLKVGSFEENALNLLSSFEFLSSIWLLNFEFLLLIVDFFCKDFERTELLPIYLLN